MESVEIDRVLAVLPSGPEMPWLDQGLERTAADLWATYQASGFDPRDRVAFHFALAKLESRGWPEPRSFGPPPASPFPAEHLPRAAREFADALSECNRMAPAMAHAAVLGLMSFGPSRLRRAVAGDHRECLALWVFLIGDSAGRKSAVMNRASEPCHAAIDEQLADAAVDARRRAANLATLRDTAAAAEKSGDDAKLARALADIAAAQASAQGPGVIIDDTTPEALLGAAAENGGWVALVTDEGSTLSVATGQRHAKNGGTALGALIKGYDGSRYASVRKSDRRDRPDGSRDAGIVSIPRLIVPMVVGMQPSVFEGLLANDSLVTQGFLPRAIVCRGTENFAAVARPPIPQSVSRAWNELIRSTMLQKPPRDRCGFIEPRELHADPAAIARNHAFEDELREKRKRNEVAGYQRLREARSHGIALRIAGVLAVTTTPDVPTIADEHMEAAICIQRWADEEVVRAAFGDANDASARALAQLICTGAVRDGDTLQSVRNRRLRGLGDVADNVRRAAAVCERMGLLRVRKSGNKSEVIDVSPRWRERWGVGAW